jgi:hypothetical protein
MFAPMYARNWRWRHSCVCRRQLARRREFMPRTSLKKLPSRKDRALRARLALQFPPHFFWKMVKSTNPTWTNLTQQSLHKCTNCKWWNLTKTRLLQLSLLQLKSAVLFSLIVSGPGLSAYVFIWLFGAIFFYGNQRGRSCYFGNRIQHEY